VKQHITVMAITIIIMMNITIITNLKHQIQDTRIPDFHYPDSVLVRHR
jgi:hypothetical protein